MDNYVNRVFGHEAEMKRQDEEFFRDTDAVEDDLDEMKDDEVALIAPVQHHVGMSARKSFMRREWHVW